MYQKFLFILKEFYIPTCLCLLLIFAKLRRYQFLSDSRSNIPQILGQFDLASGQVDPASGQTDTDIVFAH